MSPTRPHRTPRSTMLHRRLPIPGIAPANRWTPGLPIPSYRYVPGLHPHPHRHPHGHGHLRTPPWTAPAWCAERRWSDDLPYLHGVDLFNARFLWESHECWETSWHAIPGHHLDRLFFQALIQLAAGVLKTHMGHHPAAGRLHHRSRCALRRVEREAGTRYRGLDIPALEEARRAHLNGGPWPTLDLR